MHGPRPRPRRVRPGVEPLEERCVLSSAEFVAGLYAGLLHRDPTPGEVSALVASLAAGATPRQAAAGVLSSPEYQVGLLAEDYQQLLGRPLTDPDLALWAPALGPGLDPTQVTAALVSSPEFFVDHGDTPDGWAAGVYQAALGRAALPGEDAPWVGLLQGGVSPLAVARQIAQGPESAARVVEGAYEKVLGRPADLEGLLGWVSDLAGGMSPAQLDAVLASSPEFLDSRGGLDPQATVQTAVSPISPISTAGNPYWTARERQNEERLALGHAPVLFLGDSITDWLANGAGQPVWNSSFAPLGGADFAIAGFTTTQVLWQVESGQVAALTPNVVVLMIGTNDLSLGQTPQAVAQAVGTIVAQIEAHSPQSKVLLLGILPRGFSPDEPLRTPIAEVNFALSTLADGQRVWYLDAGSAFLQRDGSISPAVLSDGVHPTLRGYQVLTASIRPTLLALLRSR